MGQGFTKGIPLDTDGTLSSNSDQLVPSQKAVKTYVDARATGTNTGDETASTLGATINASSAATPNDTDLVTTVDTSVVKKITWANVKAFLKTYFDTIYQAVLVSGTNIKTINGSSVLGSGNLVVTGSGASWGSITGTLSSQTDLQSALDGKVDENVAITGATKTKITYDAKGLVTSGADATTADIADSTNKRYVTDANLTTIGNQSGTNTGDETNATIKTKLGAASSGVDGYLTGTDWNTFNGKQNALTNPVTGTGTNNEIAAFNSTGSTITSLTTATYPSLTELSYVKGLTSAVQTQLNGKEPTITNGFGITGTTTKAVALTSSAAFCTAETTISATAYADITGASITLDAGTWLIMATINGASQTTTVAVMIGAITTAANAVIAEGAQHIVAGTATVRTWGNLSLSAVVTPGVSTTYKLRGARGQTTQTGNWIASDGTGQATANNVSNNSDKSTVIMAVRIA